MNLEELLRTAVDDGVRSVPPGFADGAIRRARRQRRTTRIAVAGGVAAFALAAAAVAVVDPTEPRTDAPPAESPAPDLVDLARLGTGPAPEVPWYADGALHFGAISTRYEYLGGPANPPIVERISGGFVVTQHEPDLNDATVTIVRDDGEQIELASGLASSPYVSPDGERLAWSVQHEAPMPDSDQTFTTTVTVADAAGGFIAELPASASPYAGPAGYLADGRLVLNADVDGSGGVYAWEIGDDELTPLRRDANILTVSPATGLGVYNGRTYEVADLATGEDLWTFGNGKNPSFSPDGRYVAGADRPDVVELPGLLVLLDARTGDEVLSAAFGSIVGRRWESPTSIVLSVVQGNEAALVRCTVDGSCELATELRPADADPDTPDSPYVLG